MKAELVPENGDAPIPILRDLTVVGRREYCDVVIDHHSLSKRHCLLVKTDGLLVIRDLATTNGTKVKGQKVRWAALLPDDRVSLGGYKMRIYLGPDDMPSPSEQARGQGRGAGASRPAAPSISPWPKEVAPAIRWSPSGSPSRRGTRSRRSHPRRRPGPIPRDRRLADLRSRMTSSSRSWTMTMISSTWIE